MCLSLSISILVLLVLLTDSLHIRNGRYLDNSNLSLTTPPTERSKSQHHQVTFDDVFRYNHSFNISSDQDSLVLLHIQKTGGTTFERHLVHDLKLQTPCDCAEEKRRCWCPKSNELTNKTSTSSTWLISRFSTGWVCGLHADWTQLNACLAKLNNLFFMTFLRHPVHRFVSEFRHVQRGATWKASKIHCRNHNTQLCYGDQPNWLNVTLEDFLSCSSNMAINRQTYMLADLNKIGCQDEKYASSTDRDIATLDSAKDNLRKIAFFGLCEQQRASQMIFEETFRLKFEVDFRQSDDNKTKILIDRMSKDTRNRIIEMNHLDMKLYEFAVDLFQARCKELSSECDRTLMS